MHYLLVSGCSEGCSRRRMKANSSKSTYNILCNKKEIISQHLQHFTGGYPPGISSDPPDFYRTYLNAVEVVQGDLLFHWCLYKVIYASWIYRKSSGLFKCRVYDVCTQFEGGDQRSGPGRQRWCKSEPAHCSRLESWPGGKSFKN